MYDIISQHTPDELGWQVQEQPIDRYLKIGKCCVKYNLTCDIAEVRGSWSHVKIDK
jgi:hypothetical protein